MKNDDEAIDDFIPILIQKPKQLSPSIVNYS